MQRSYSVISYHALDVAWIPELDGGGQSSAPVFRSVVGELFGPVEHVYEVCAGCGFIGFSLLANGLCERLTLSDINPEAVDAMRETVRRNKLQDRVEVYLSDGLAAVPRSRRFNLVVSNPPWYPADTGSLITDDLGWAFHRAFYAGIADYLSDGASLLFCENSGGAEPDVFAPMLTAGGLSQVQTLRHAADPNPAQYFLWSKRLPADLLLQPMAQPETMDIELSSAHPSHYELRTGRWYRATVANRLGRPVNVVLSSAAGEGVCLPLQAESTVRLPSFVLSPGEYRLRDGLTDMTLATIGVPGRASRTATEPAEPDWPSLPPPEPLVIEVTSVQTEHQLRPNVVYSGHAVNRLRRDVRLVLRDSTGRELAGSVPLPAGASAAIPNIALAPGDYRLYDTLTNSSLSVIRVPSSP